MYLSQVGERVRSLRQSKKLTQAQLSEKLGVARETITRIENDCNVPRAGIVEALCEYFNVNAAYLLHGSVTNSKEVVNELDVVIITLQMIRNKISSNPNLSEMNFYEDDSSEKML